MLNYIWFALLALGIGTALTLDIIDLSTNKYKSGESLNVICQLDEKVIDEKKSFNSTLHITSKTFNDFYKSSIQNDIEQKVKLTKTENQNTFLLYFTIGNDTSEIWKTIAKSSGKEDDITGRLVLRNKIDSIHYSASMYLEKASFIKMKEVTNATIEYASTAVKIALGLIGIMALWLGIMKIAEESGIINIIAKAVRPFTKFLFPDVPQNHPAIASMIMNISANML